MSPAKETFHVVIRIPSKRPKGFVEPPSIVWTDEMERKLWQYMSQKNTDWNIIAEQLGVPTSYIVRHAAFIYETQLRGIHQQLRNNTSMSRNSAKSPTPSLKRPNSVRYSNTFQQSTLQENEQSSTVATTKATIPQDLVMTRNNNDPMITSNVSNNNAVLGAASETPTQQAVQSPLANSLFKSSTSQKVHDDKGDLQYNTNARESEDDGDFRNDDGDHDEDEQETHERIKETVKEEEEDEEQEFSSHFERMKLQVEEPAFLPRRLSGGSHHSNLSLSRQQLSLSIQNLRKPTTNTTAYVPEVTTPSTTSQSSSLSAAAVAIAAVATTNSSYSSSSTTRKTLSPAIRPFNNVTSAHDGSNNNSAVNSSTSSFSDISESSVTQSAMEDAFLSNFNHGSKMSLMSFSRKYKE